MSRVALTLASALLLGGATLGAQTVTPTSPPPRAELVRRLDSLVADFLTEGPSVGATVAVIRARDTLMLKGAGLRDREGARAADAGTIYRIGSITKQFTAAGIMQLVEQKKISLEDPLSRYLPQYPQWGHVTIRQLLDHTSGIHSYTASNTWAETWSEDRTPAAILSFVERDTFDFAPGTQWRYNNSGYMLLGMVLEKVSGQSYADYLSRHFFLPLGMTSATYCPSRPSGDAWALGYEKTPGGVRPARYMSMTHPWAAGALCMSVPDFLRWQEALTSGRVVTSASYQRMTTSDTLLNGKSTGYGFGLFPASLGTHRMINHGGDVHGFSAEQLWLPDDSLRVVVFTNTLGSAPTWLARNLASAVLGLPVRGKPKLPPAVPLPAANRAKYLGTYDLVVPGGTQPFTITLTEGPDGVVAQAEGQPSIPFVYLGDDTFGAAFDPTLRFTVQFENGIAVRARLTQRGRSLEGPRR